MLWADVSCGAVVVAHPDDECLFAAGLLIRYPERWTVFCCTIPRTDPIRALKFFDACEVLGARGVLFPFTEAEPRARLEHLDRLDLDGFDLVVTHNADGEYGHLHHRQIHSHIMERWPEKTACFGWKLGGHGRDVLHLRAGEQEQKLAALKCYDHTSPFDGKPKWQALLDRYAIDLRIESHDPPG